MSTFEVIAYRRPWRVAAALLAGVSRCGLLLLAVLLFFPDVWPEVGGRLDNPLRLFRGVASLSLLPGVAGWLLQRAFAARASIGDGVLTLRRAGQRIEMATAAIAAVRPWRLPLPAGGVSLRLDAGRRFRLALQVRDPVAFAAALGAAGVADGTSAAAHPVARYAASRAVWRRRWYHPLLAFGLFGLVPALPVFRLHQWVAYGGTFGEYYMYGLRAYVAGLAIFWGTAVVYLVLYAAVLRAVVETLAYATAWLAPMRLPAVRGAAETARRGLYFGAVPLFLLRLYLAS
ncbi:hypothetical protein KF840_05190 [bacterium]|nr:hypothetical protein [bacterium]